MGKHTVNVVLEMELNRLGESWCTFQLSIKTK
jgi:hypothetical protein